MTQAKTGLAYGNPQALVQQAAGVFAQCQQRNTTLNRLTGKMPQVAGAIATIQKQSSNNMPIVQAQDLGKGKGDEIRFNLINPSGGYLSQFGGAVQSGRQMTRAYVDNAKKNF